MKQYLTLALLISSQTIYMFIVTLVKLKAKRTLTIVCDNVIYFVCTVPHCNRANCMSNASVVDVTSLVIQYGQQDHLII